MNRSGHNKGFRRSLRDLELFRNQAAQLLDAFGAQDKFQSRHKLVLAVPRFREYPQDGFDSGKQFFFGQKIREDRGLRRQAAQPAADEHLEATMRRAVVAADLRDEADVVNARDRASAIVLAAGEGNLELARQVMKIRMAQKIP